MVFTINDDGSVDVASSIVPEPHVVVIDVRHEFTDSPVIVEASEAEMAEWIAAHRNEGYEDRNP